MTPTVAIQITVNCGHSHQTEAVSENPTDPFLQRPPLYLFISCVMARRGIWTLTCLCLQKKASFAFLMRTNFKPFWHYLCYRITQGNASAGWIINVYRFMVPGEIKSHPYPQIFLFLPGRGEKLADVEKITPSTSPQFPLVIKLYWQIAMDSHQMTSQFLN